MTVSGLLTPSSHSRAIELGNRLWRTQLLPLGEINYKGRKIKFDREYLAGLVQAFRDRAFNQVPFQLADGQNKHNNDPERYRGKIVGLEMAQDGLDLLLEPTEAGEKLLQQNPELGVSARIYEDYERADGKTWTQALQHVLGTLDPRVPGMRGWTEVEVPVALSQQIGDVEVVDLSDESFGEEEGGKGKVAFSKEDREQLVTLLKKVRDGDVSDEDLEGLVDELDTEEVDDETELTDDELEKLIAQAEQEDGEEGDEDTEAEDEEDGEREPQLISASRTGGGAIELANAQLQAQGEELDRVRATLDDQAYTNEKRVFVHDLGLPPKVIDMARPLLEGTGHVVELTGGDEIDAGQVMRNVLREIGQQIKMLDLSGLIGRGLEDDEEAAEAEQVAQQTTDFVKTARQQFGL
jgi:hypothetical protein